jgi:hypothetical protein
LRRALPVGIGGDHETLRVLREGFRVFADVLVQDGSAEQALSTLVDDFVRLARVMPDGSFLADLDRLETIDLGTHLVRRPELACRVITSDDAVMLQFANSAVRGPFEYQNAMAFVANSVVPFTVNDLPIRDPGRRISLAQRLLRDGLLMFADGRTIPPQ